MKEGYKFLNAIKVISNTRIVNMLNKCSDKYGGCAECPDGVQCVAKYDQKLTNYSTNMVIERDKEREIKELLKTGWDNEVKSKVGG